MMVTNDPLVSCGTLEDSILHDDSTFSNNINIFILFSLLLCYYIFFITFSCLKKKLVK